MRDTNKFNSLGMIEFSLICIPMDIQPPEMEEKQQKHAGKLKRSFVQETGVFEIPF